MSSSSPPLPPLVSLCKAGQAPAVLSLLSSCPRPPSALVEVAFLAAVEHGHAALLPPLAQLLSTPLPALHRRAEPAVVLAARLGHLACLDFLVGPGAVPVDQPARDTRRTALMAAVEQRQTQAVRHLLQAKADVHASDSQGLTPLHIAAAHGDAALVSLLLQNGASLVAVNEDGESPLELAGNCDAARTLLEHVVPYPEERLESSCSASSVYAALRSGPGATLFWSAIGVGRDNLMFQQFGVYPFDRLNDTERILILTEICEVIAGYRPMATQDVLRDSARFAVFAMMKSRLKKEIEAGVGHAATASVTASTKPDAIEAPQFEWRRKVVAAFESIFQCRADDLGLSVDCVRRVVWNTIINMIAKQTDRDARYFWDKRRVFSCSNGPERPLLVATSEWCIPDGYFTASLPTPQQLTQQQVQITFKKLMTMTKSYLMDEEGEASGCFCQECIAEREVPLTFKLQFLDENADQFQALAKHPKKQDFLHFMEMLLAKSTAKKQPAKRSAKKPPTAPLVVAHHEMPVPASATASAHPGAGAAGPCCPATRLSCPTLRDRCDALLLAAGADLAKFWCNLNTEDKWLLTEISTHELADLIAENRNHDWESLRAALHSYSLYQWEEDLLEISDDVVTISDDMSESKDLNDLIHIMLEAAVRLLTCPEAAPRAPTPPPTPVVLAHARQCLTASGRPEECQRCLSDEEWDRRGRQQLETLVLCEFARKVACSFLYASEASRAQRIALELELELLQEEEQLIRMIEKKHKRRKAKSRKKKGRSSAAALPRPSEASGGETTCAAIAADSSASSDEGDPPLLPLPVSLPPPKTPLPRRPKSATAPAAVPRPSTVSSPPTPSSPKPARTSPSAPMRAVPQAPRVPGGYDHGMMFICTDDTYAECQALGLFGLPRQHLNAVLECRPGGATALFLFNISTRLLHGLFEPASPGRDTIDPMAWARPAGSPTPFPAQIAFQCVGGGQKPPLPEAVFRHIFPDGNRIRKLTGPQVQLLLQTWDQYGDKAVAESVPPPPALKKTPKRPVTAAPPLPVSVKAVLPAPAMPRRAQHDTTTPSRTPPLLSAPIPSLPSASIWAVNAPSRSSWSRDGATTQSATVPPRNSLSLFGDWNGIWSAPTNMPATW